MRTSNAVLVSASSESKNGDLDHVFLLQLAGIFFVVSALVTAPPLLLSLEKVSTTEIDTIFYLGGKLFELAVGLYLLIKPQAWAHMLNRFRGRE